MTHDRVQIRVFVITVMGILTPQQKAWFHVVVSAFRAKNSVYMFSSSLENTTHMKSRNVTSYEIYPPPPDYTDTGKGKVVPVF
jgi:hypothetical protein